MMYAFSKGCPDALIAFHRAASWKFQYTPSASQF